MHQTPHKPKHGNPVLYMAFSIVGLVGIGLIIFAFFAGVKGSMRSDQQHRDAIRMYSKDLNDSSTSTAKAEKQRNELVDFSNKIVDQAKDFDQIKTQLESVSSNGVPVVFVEVPVTASPAQAERLRSVADQIVSLCRKQHWIAGKESLKKPYPRAGGQQEYGGEITRFNSDKDTMTCFDKVVKAIQEGVKIKLLPQEISHQISTHTPKCEFDLYLFSD